MHPLEPVPAIRRIDTDRADLCALEVVGRLTSADVENAIGLIEAARLGHESIDLMVRLRGYEGLDWDLGASTLRGKRDALRRVRRCAILGGPAWIATAFGLLGFIAPLESRRFEEADEEAAWEWLGTLPLGDAG